MTKIQYVGPYTDGVYIPAFDTGDIFPGDVVEVPDDLAASLLEQVGNWQKPHTPKESK